MTRDQSPRMNADQDRSRDEEAQAVPPPPCLYPRVSAGSDPASSAFRFGPMPPHDPVAYARSAGLDPARLPRHVAVIMDGNGRWAVERGKPRVEGHLRGADVVRATVTESCKLG